MLLACFVLSGSAGEITLSFSRKTESGEKQQIFQHTESDFNVIMNTDNKVVGIFPFFLNKTCQN